MLAYTRYLVNSFHITARIPPDILTMICSHLSTEGDAFSVSQVCRYWREVLILSPSLWIRIPCRRVSRTIASLERCKSVPIQLRFDSDSSTVALENVISHGGKMASLTINDDSNRAAPLNTLFASPMPSLKQLHVYSCGTQWQEDEGQKADAFRESLPSLRELFVCQFPVHIGKITSPNLVHLALENTGREVTTQLILDVLRGSPLLETVLIIHPRTPPREIPLNSSPVRLPSLRSIELGVHEVCSGLITYLRFPRTVAVGFRSLETSDVIGNNVPPAAMASSQRVLGRIDIHTVILAVAASDSEGHLRSLVRFEGVDCSLEMTFQHWDTEAASTLFGSDGVLSSFASRLGGVTELQIAGCYIPSLLGVGRVATTMPSLTSIYFFHCDRDKRGTIFGLVSGSAYRPWPPFLRLERLTVLEPGPGLIELCRWRKSRRVPLRAVSIGPEPSPYTPEQIAELRKFVDEVRVEIPRGISERSVGNKILDTWSGIGIPGPVS